MSDNYRDESRNNWRRPGNLEPGDLQIGCLQRIADACELMAQGHQNLVNRERWANERAERLSRENDRLARSNAALRGLIKRMKRAADAAKEK